MKKIILTSFLAAISWLANSQDLRYLGPVMITDSLGNDIGICKNYYAKEKVNKTMYIVDLMYCPIETHNPLAKSTLIVQKGTGMSWNSLANTKAREYRLEEGIDNAFTLVNDGTKLIFQYYQNGKFKRIEL